MTCRGIDLGRSWWTALACLVLVALGAPQVRGQAKVFEGGLFAVELDDDLPWVDARPWATDEPEPRDLPELTGDWWGARSDLASRGVEFHADNTSFLMGNTTGGARQSAAFGGHGDYLLHVDGGRSGLVEGLHIKLRAEHRFGESITEDVGAFFSPALIADLPVFGSQRMYLTNVLVTQQLGDSLAVFAGKMDTLDGDKNALAHARGKTQFSNMAFVFNPIVSATVPYATLGAGFVVLREGEPVLTASVLNSSDTTGTSGFEQLFNDGALLSLGLRLPTRIGGRLGHQFFGGTWNSRTYTALGESYIDYPDVQLPTTRGSWSLFWNCDQLLVVDPHDQGRGWGAFARAGIADPDTSPLAWFVSCGLGGNVLWPARPRDTFGAGWYYAGTSDRIDSLLAAQFGPVGDGQGIECFYNYELTPAVRVTPDVQWIVPALRTLDPSLLAGVRMQMIF